MVTATRHEIGHSRAADDPALSPRTERVLAAIDDHKDFTLVELRVAAIADAVLDVIVVECLCDGVPSRNRVGIEYKEPIAIVIARDPALLPRVRALRRDFPVTPHQSAVPDGSAPELCLYAQRPVAVLRTWTAPAFLRTIQWWFTETAHERLHQLDQPVEQLFFDSPDEIVLPAGYLATVDSSNTSLIITDMVSRYLPNDTQREHPACTVILGPPETPGRKSFPVRLVQIALTPITHGTIERTPSTLGGLEDQLRVRGAGVMDHLIAVIKQHVGEGGCAAEKEQIATILLLATPIRRTPSVLPEQLQVLAFWIHTDLLSIGEAAGALIRTLPIPATPPRYYIDHRLDGTPPSEAWRKLLLNSLNVRVLPDAIGARRMSGTNDAGPRGVVAGVGALGSTILDLWRRCGWGQWDAIDPDHLQPHNLVRHTAHYLGLPKAEAVARRDKYIWRDAEPKIGAIVGDAYDLKNPAVKAAFDRAELIVDTTTTLEVPRRLANLEFSARVVSSFLTPTGTDAVLIAEDSARLLRIDALEAQYWRAVLTRSWGETHLTNSITKFTSGASCRDVSVVMSYSAIMAHAATLSEQIQTLPAKGIIRIWQRDRTRGSVATHDILVWETLTTIFPDLTVVWDQGTLTKVQSLRRAALPAETGGVLVGYHDLNEGRVYVVDALDASPDSIGTREFFERGVKGLRPRIDAVGRRSAGQIGYLGEWHSHPQGHDARQSGNDVRQLLYLGDLLGGESLPALMLIVAEHDHQWLMSLPANDV
jgi:integrative and conjugative element protein (TIGR02256 family)